MGCDSRTRYLSRTSAEHCFALHDRKRIRIIQKMRRQDNQWELTEVEVVSERWEADYNGGKELAGLISHDWLMNHCAQFVDLVLKRFRCPSLKSNIACLLRLWQACKHTEQNLQASPTVSTFPFHRPCHNRLDVITSRQRFCRCKDLTDDASAGCGGGVPGFATRAQLTPRDLPVSWRELESQIRGSSGASTYTRYLLPTMRRPVRQGRTINCTKNLLSFIGFCRVHVARML